MQFKGLIAVLLLICFSIYLGHNLVPHHHHAEVFLSPLTTDCPFEHGDHHGSEHDHDDDTESKTESHPLHCHAFNDVVFQKYSVPALPPWTTGIKLILASGQSNLPEEILYTSPYTHAALKLPCRAAIYPGSKGLRAPPLSA